MDKKFMEWKSDDVDAMVVVVGDASKLCDCIKPYYKRLIDKKVFEGKVGENALATVDCGSKLVDTVLVGGGNKINKKFLDGLAKAFRTLKGLKAEKIGFDFAGATGSIQKLSRSIGEIFTMANYDFDDFKSDSKPSTLKQLYFKGLDFDKQAYEEGVILGESNVYARILVNTPANILTPEKLSEYAKADGEKAGLEVEVKGLEEIRELGMKSYLAVAEGSDNEPKLIVLRWKGNKESNEVLGYVGKGVTYDSGGLSLKPSNGMMTMKSDMAGSAAVIAAIIGIARLGLKINVTAVVAACENMPSARSYKPGDIISSMAGKSIFVGNTDAEGRLTLVDAVTYMIEKEKATKLLDIATLTGAAVRALGETVSGVCTNDKKFYTQLEKSFKKMNENMWRMPLFDDYRELLKHYEADLNNAAGTPGMMTAALFIEAFVQDIPWLHVDIAGPSFASKATALHGKGATGAAVRPLIDLAKKLQ